MALTPREWAALALLSVITGCTYVEAQQNAQVLMGVWTAEYKALQGNRTQSS